MSKHKTSAKKLIIEDDDQPLDGDELNPFSFKEFIRSKNEYSGTKGDFHGENHLSGTKIYGSAYPVEEESYSYHKDLDLNRQGHFFTGPKHISQCEKNDLENEDSWMGTYQPAAVEEAHELSRCGAVDNSSYLGESSMASEDKLETDSEWQEDEEFSPESRLPRRSTGSYEGDEETSIADLSFHMKESTGGNWSWDLRIVREENSQLRRHVKELLKKSEADSLCIRQLTDELHNRKMREEKEAKALETMVHSVEQNLQQMTKRAVKAENTVSKLKQEVLQLQSHLEGYKSENERLQACENAAITTMKHNAQVASGCLNKAVHEAEMSIRQLLTGAETLSLVSQLLSSIDKITEIHN